MSDHLELVRWVYAARDSAEGADFARWAHPDIEVVSLGGARPETWQGLDGLAQALAEWRDAWVDFHAEPEEFRELDAGRVLVLLRRSGRGRTSGVDLDGLRSEGAAVFHFRGARVGRIVNYFDRSQALADLGLEG
jgi:hypothetical protein